jgi:NAD(P)-dependent dehydrogenase (short-subunit alcohol dehydrogenase family)
MERSTRGIYGADVHVFEISEPGRHFVLPRIVGARSQHCFGCGRGETVSPGAGARPDRFDLTGKVVLVTGGNSGIGLAMAEAMADAGADVCIWGRNASRNAAAEKRLAASGGRVRAQQVEISDEDQVVGAMAELAEDLGHIDGCFANAAAHGDSRAPFVESSLEDWRAVTSTVLDGTYLTLREAAKVMVRQGTGGSLVATSSAAAHYGVPHNESYSAAKAGVLALIRGLAVELARYGIRANSISPAWVLSSFMDGIVGNDDRTAKIQSRIPLRRWAEPEELAGLAVYLASDASSWHTGDEFRLDGGYAVK